MGFLRRKKSEEALAATNNTEPIETKWSKIGEDVPFAGKAYVDKIAEVDAAANAELAEIMNSEAAQFLAKNAGDSIGLPNDNKNKIDEGGEEIKNSPDWIKNALGTGPEQAKTREETEELFEKGHQNRAELLENMSKVHIKTEGEIIEQIAQMIERSQQDLGIEITHEEALRRANAAIENSKKKENG